MNLHTSEVHSFLAILYLHLIQSHHMRIFLITAFCFSVFFSPAQEQPMAFVNAKVYTVNAKQPVAEAVVIQKGRIIFVGSTKDALKKIKDKKRITDCAGKLLLPGFIDDHTHFMTGGFYLLGINLRQARSTQEFISTIKKYAAGHTGTWIEGGDWDHEAWELKDLPTKGMIDSVTPRTPVFVNRFDGHMALANSYALKLAGIDRNTVAPAGGLIVKDSAGEPTGVLKDNAMDLVNRVIPTASPAQYEQALERALQEAREKGVTSVQDITQNNDLRTFQSFEKKGKLTCRIYTRMPIASYKFLVDEKLTAGSGSPFIRFGSLKAFADGSLGSSTALFFEPYKQDSTTRGLPMGILSNGKLREWALDADKHHLQISIHAIGDSANFLILNLFEEIIKTNPQWDRRFRIEHAQHIRFSDIGRMAKMGVIASVQPYHAIDDGVWAEKRIGDRIRYTYPFKSFIDSSVKMGFGSDWTVAPINPLLGIYAAVTRQTLDGSHPEGWIPEQKITVAQAIQCYTINNAFAAFEEKQKGSIETGKYADLVMLSDDILSIDPVKIREVQVVMTVVNGKVVYKKP